MLDRGMKGRVNEKKIALTFPIEGSTSGKLACRE